MYPLLALSIFTVAIAIERFYYYRANRRGFKKAFLPVLIMLFVISNGIRRKISAGNSLRLSAALLPAASGIRMMKKP